MENMNIYSLLSLRICIPFLKLNMTWKLAPEHGYQYITLQFYYTWLHTWNSWSSCTVNREIFALFALVFESVEGKNYIKIALHVYSITLYFLHGLIFGVFFFKFLILYAFVCSVLTCIFDVSFYLALNKCIKFDYFIVAK